MNHFEQLGFAPAYACDVNPEYSSDGSTHMILFTPEGRTLTGAGLCVSVNPDNRDTWIGTFDWGYAELTQICACPNPNHLCVVAQGWLYIVDVNNPANFLMPNFTPITTVIAIPTRKKLLFANFTNLMALGLDGVEWVSDRVSSDGIKIEWVNDSLCHLKGWSAAYNREVNIEVDLETGAILKSDIDPKSFGK